MTDTISVRELIELLQGIENQDDEITVGITLVEKNTIKIELELEYLGNFAKDFGN